MILCCCRVSDEVIEQTVRAEPARTGKLHAEMQVFVAFGPGVGLQNHRNAQPVALAARARRVQHPALQRHART